MVAVDAHQHLWPEAVLRRLEARTSPPCATWGAGVWTLELPGEPAFTVDPADHDVAARAAAVIDAGLDRALVALSTPVGIEALPAAEALDVLEAWVSATAALPSPLQAWGSVPLALPAGALADATHAALDAGATGVIVPAGALTDRAGLERVAPLLDALTARLAPVFVHPGPAPWTPPARYAPTVAAGVRPSGAGPPTPPPAGGAALAGRSGVLTTAWAASPADGPAAEPWWAPSVGYVAQLHAAWHAWTAWGRTEHPGLRVLWAALAGLAPLHAERTALRGGPDPGEPNSLDFYDTSGYGPRALRWMACAAGTSQLVHGSDRPVVAIDPLAGEPLGEDAHLAMRTENVARLLGSVWVAA